MENEQFFLLPLIAFSMRSIECMMSVTMQFEAAWSIAEEVFEEVQQFVLCCCFSLCCYEQLAVEDVLVCADLPLPSVSVCSPSVFTGSCMFAATADCTSRNLVSLISWSLVRYWVRKTCTREMQ